ncbi:MAG: DUF882 domain-containing protein [Rubellimicrobium sp.]|nr:DUF882 domain-containing protein [Rubellimicrobium sp.]
MMQTSATGVSRRGILGVFAALTVAAAPTMSKAAGLMRGAGDVRKLKMYNGRTGESLETVYWIDGDYIGEAVREVSLFMRDWRNGEAVAIDTRTMDIMAASHRLLDVSAPYMLLSGYRSPATNSMLARNTRGVASNSLHMRGQAADLRVEGRSVSQIASAATSCQAGGVGRYPRSNFVHMDCGQVRYWAG